jgi:hypothetical protein
MSGSEKDRLAALVIDQHYAFQEALAGSRKRYPTREFGSFAAVMRRYVDATRKDEMLHRGVVQAVNGAVGAAVILTAPDVQLVDVTSNGAEFPQTLAAAVPLRIVSIVWRIPSG